MAAHWRLDQIRVCLCAGELDRGEERGKFRWRPQRKSSGRAGSIQSSFTCRRWRHLPSNWKSNSRPARHV